MKKVVISIDMFEDITDDKINKISEKIIKSEKNIIQVKKSREKIYK